MIPWLACAADPSSPSSPATGPSTTFTPETSAWTGVSTWPTEGAAPTGDTGGDEGVPVLMGVGYGGLRVLSRDGGLTWGDRVVFAAAGGDDEDLLRAVAYGDGLWIATGWKLVTSTDGATWTDRGQIKDFLPGCNVVEGLAFALDAFWGVCSDWYGQGQVYRSDDGLVWANVATLGHTEGHTFLTYREGTFAAYGDTLTTFTSADGLGWTELPGVSRGTWCEGAWRSESDCHDASWFDGAFYRSGWPDRIERSTDGEAWSLVYQDPEQNSLYQPRAVAAGFVPN